MSELLPCPFCGSPARTVLNMDDVETWAQCTKRKPSRCPMSSTIISIADWNKRPAQQPAAAPVSGDVALPELPSRELRDLIRSVYDKAYENGRADASAKNCSRYIGRRVEDEQGNEVEAIASTYGQQCSDAALERAAKAIDEFADKHLTGDDLKCALALIDVVRALKGGTA